MELIYSFMVNFFSRKKRLQFILDLFEEKK